jgi:hypothetical protein
LAGYAMRFDFLRSDGTADKVVLPVTYCELSNGRRGRSASTERWQDFLVLMRRAPSTRATQRGIDEAERELAYRRSRGLPVPKSPTTIT